MSVFLAMKRQKRLQWNIVARLKLIEVASQLRSGERTDSTVSLLCCTSRVPLGVKQKHQVGEVKLYWAPLKDWEQCLVVRCETAPDCYHSAVCRVKWELKMQARVLASGFHFILTGLMKRTGRGLDIQWLTGRVATWSAHRGTETERERTADEASGTDEGLWRIGSSSMIHAPAISVSLYNAWMCHCAVWYYDTE